MRNRELPPIRHTDRKRSERRRAMRASKLFNRHRKTLGLDAKESIDRITTSRWAATSSGPAIGSQRSGAEETLEWLSRTENPPIDTATRSESRMRRRAAARRADRPDGSSRCARPGCPASRSLRSSGLIRLGPRRFSTFAGRLPLRRIATTRILSDATRGTYEQTAIRHGGDPGDRVDHPDPLYGEGPWDQPSAALESRSCRVHDGARRPRSRTAVR